MIELFSGRYSTICSQPKQDYTEWESKMFSHQTVLSMIGMNLTNSSMLLSVVQRTEVTDWLFQRLHLHLPSLSPHQIVLLSLHEDMEIPVVWLVAQVISYIWSRIQLKKKGLLMQTRANLEAGISIMWKTRFKESCVQIENLISN